MCNLLCEANTEKWLISNHLNWKLSFPRRVVFHVISTYYVWCPPSAISAIAEMKLVAFILCLFFLLEELKSYRWCCRLEFCPISSLEMLLDVEVWAGCRSIVALWLALVSAALSPERHGDVSSSPASSDLGICSGFARAFFPCPCYYLYVVFCRLLNPLSRSCPHLGCWNLQEPAMSGTGQPWPHLAGAKYKLCVLEKGRQLVCFSYSPCTSLVYQ